MAIAALLGGATGLRADLIKVSPFLPPQNAPSAVSQNTEVKYMGWVETPQGTLYRVYDPARKAGNFLKLGEKDTNLDVVVKQHDNDRDTLTVEHGGQTLTLPENDSKVSSSGALPQMIPGPVAQMGGPNVSPAVTNTVVLNPTPADEQKRLEAVAAEVARRRALREQAQQQTQMQGQPGAVPQPPQAAPTRQDMQQQMQQQYPGRQRTNRRGQ